MSNEEEGRFSRRYGHHPEEAEITVRDDAPDDLRFAILAIARDVLRVKPSTLRDIVCRELRTRPDPSNWSEYPNVLSEVEELVQCCEWFRVYDIVEAIYDFASRRFEAEPFEVAVNDFFREKGIGWQLKNGRVETRGEQTFEAVLHEAEESLVNAELPTAKSELAEAIQDMSRRPDPDLSGAVHHAMAALECVAGHASGDSRSTLGEVMKRNPGLFPRPLDEVVAKCWGFSSEKARHGKEGRELEYGEAQLVVGLCATLVTYLAGKM